MTQNNELATIEEMAEALKTPVADFSPAGLGSMASYISQVEVMNPVIRFTPDQLLSILHKTLPSAKNMTGNEFKSYIETCMMEGANPVIGDVWGVKVKDNPLGIWFHYEWVIRKAREKCPSFTFGKVEWGDDKGNWFDVWPYDPTTERFISTKASDEDESPWVKMVPYVGRIYYKTAEMVEFEPVVLYWHERGKFENEWKKQALHLMEKCLKTKAIRLIPKMSNYYIQEEMPEITENGVWQPGDAPASEKVRDITQRVSDRKRHRGGDLRDNDALPVDAKDKERMKLVFIDLGMLKATERVSFCNEVLKANEMDTIKKTAELTKGQCAMILEAARAEIKAKQDDEDGEEHPFFKNEPEDKKS